MNSDDLDADQAQKLVDAIRRQLRYLNRLSARMQALQFRPDDPLLRAAVKARDAAHYASCKGGVGRPEGQSDGNDGNR